MASKLVEFSRQEQRYESMAKHPHDERISRSRRRGVCERVRRPNVCEDGGAIFGQKIRKGFKFELPSSCHLIRMLLVFVIGLRDGPDQVLGAGIIV